MAVEFFLSKLFYLAVKKTKITPTKSQLVGVGYYKQTQAVPLKTFRHITVISHITVPSAGMGNAKISAVVIAGGTKPLGPEVDELVVIGSQSGPEKNL